MHRARVNMEHKTSGIYLLSDIDNQNSASICKFQKITNTSVHNIMNNFDNEIQYC